MPGSTIMILHCSELSLKFISQKITSYDPATCTRLGWNPALYTYHTIKLMTNANMPKYVLKWLCEGGMWVDI